ncbi:hypothetical protein GGI10_004169 [Coemansia sp. RSA 2530]|nr:hypothetical protein GGI10_004169 [Coemansia sp. RSA 2530]
MKASTFICLQLALVAMFSWTASAHTHLRDLKIGTTQYERGVCIRPYNSTTMFSFPSKDPTDKYMRCRTPSVDSKADKQCDIKAGSKKWCIDTVNDNNGTLDITIPSDILAGKYLLRTEIIALHLAAVPFTGGKDGAEYYSNCAELTVSGGGKTVPKGVAIPGVYKVDMPGIVFNTSAPFTSYKIPGPPVYKVGDPSGPTKPDTGAKKPCIKKRRRRQLTEDL